MVYGFNLFILAIMLWKNFAKAWACMSHYFTESNTNTNPMCIKFLAVDCLWIVSEIRGIFTGQWFKVCFK